MWQLLKYVSCHGQELYCGSGGAGGFELELEQDESIVLVVDTPAELPPVSGQLRYNLGATWAD